MPGDYVNVVKTTPQFLRYLIKDYSSAVSGGIVAMAPPPSNFDSVNAGSDSAVMTPEDQYGEPVKGWSFFSQVVMEANVTIDYNPASPYVAGTFTIPLTCQNVYNGATQTYSDVTESIVVNLDPADPTQNTESLIAIAIANAITAGSAVFEANVGAYPYSSIVYIRGKAGTQYSNLNIIIGTIVSTCGPNLVYVDEDMGAYNPDSYVIANVWVRNQAFRWDSNFDALRRDSPPGVWNLIVTGQKMTQGTIYHVPHRGDALYVQLLSASAPGGRGFACVYAANDLATEGLPAITLPASSGSSGGSNGADGTLAGGSNAAALTTYGESAVAENTPVVQIDPMNLDIESQVISERVIAPGTCLNTQTSFNVLSTASNGFARLESKRLLRYKAGEGALVRFSAAYTDPKIGSQSLAGAFDAEDGYAFGYPMVEATLSVDAIATANGNITITLNATVFTIAVVAGDARDVVAGKIVAAINGSGAWLAAIKPGTTATVVFANSGVAAVTVAFADTTIPATGVSATTHSSHLPTFSILHRREGQRAVCSARLTGAASGAGTVTVTLDGVDYGVVVAGLIPTVLLTANAIADYFNNTAVDGSGNRASNLWTSYVVIDGANFDIYFMSKFARAAQGTVSIDYNTASTGITGGALGLAATGRAPTETWVSQDAWNIDQMGWVGAAPQNFEHLGPSGMVLDPAGKGNVYQISYQNLSYGAVVFSIENPATGLYAPVHIMRFGNVTPDPNGVYGLAKLALPLAIEAETGAGYDRFGYVSSSGLAGFVEGEVRHLEQRQALRASRPGTLNTVAVGTTMLPILAIRNPPYVASQTWSTASEFIQSALSVAADGATPVEFAVVLNPTLNIVSNGYLKITHKADAGGDITVTLNATSFTVAVLLGDTPSQIATKIAAEINATGAAAGWSAAVHSTDDTAVYFLSKAIDAVTVAFVDTDTTGTTASVQNSGTDPTLAFKDLSAQSTIQFLNAESVIPTGQSAVPVSYTGGFEIFAGNVSRYGNVLADLLPSDLVVEPGDVIVIAARAFTGTANVMMALSCFEDS